MPTVGSIIQDRFELRRKVGAGGMGEVWQAVDRRTAQLVAVKFVRSDDTSAMDRFRRETRILARLPHENIVRYIDDGTTPLHEPWLAMEWLEGSDLSAVLLSGSLSVEDSINIGIRVARALGAAHNHDEPIVYRDVKPSNIFLVERDPSRVKVLDFGIAFIQDINRITMTGAVMGSCGYMSPEQIHNIPHEIGPQSDIFVLGAVLFECLLGRRAFPGNNPFAVMGKICVEEVPHLSALRNDVPTALADLIGQMLQKDRRRRPQSAEELASKLEAIHDKPDTRPPSSVKELGALISSFAPPPKSEIPAAQIPQASAVPIVEPFAPASARLSSQEKLLRFLVVAKMPYVDDPSGMGDTLRSDIDKPALMAELSDTLDPQCDHLYELPGSAILVVLQGRRNPVEVAHRATRLALHVSRIMKRARCAVVKYRVESNDKQPDGTTMEEVFRFVEPRNDTNQGPEEPSHARVRLDDVTYGLVKNHFDTVSIGSAVYLRGDRETNTIRKKHLPYVGREEDLEMVRRRIVQAWERKNPVAVIVVAEPGAGKSRLRFELTTWLAKHRSDANIVIGRADPMRTRSAFSLVGSALRSAAKIRSGESLSTSQDKLLELLGRVLSGEKRRLTAELLGEAIGVRFPGEGRGLLHSARANATLMAMVVSGAFLDYIDALTKKSPLLLVLDDLTYGDEASLKLINTALDKLGGNQFAVLASASPDLELRLPGLWKGRDVQRVQLNALHPADAERLVRLALGDGASDEGIQRIVKQGEGNAFFLEELCRAAKEGRGDHVPDTILGLVGARMDSPIMTDDARKVLRAASIFGPNAWENGIRVLVDGVDGKPTLSLGQTIELLVEQDFLEPKLSSRFEGEVEYRFRHELVREEAYRRLVDADLQVGHRLAAEWLVKAGEKDPGLLAYHFEKGGEKERAVAYCIKGAEQALAGGMLDAAIELSQKGIRLGEKAADLGELWAITTEAQSWKSNHQAAYETAQHALQLANPGSRAHARALGSAIRSALSLNNQEEALRLSASLLDIEPEPDAVLALSWAFRATITSLLETRSAVALPYLSRLEDITQGAARIDPAVTAWTLHTRAHWLRTVAHKPAEALELDQESIKHFETIGVRRYLAYAQCYVGLDYLELGLFEKAEDALREGLKDEPLDSFISMVGRSIRVELLLKRNAFEDARNEAASVAKLADERGEKQIAKKARKLEALANRALGPNAKPPGTIVEEEAAATAIRPQDIALVGIDLTPEG